MAEDKKDPKWLLADAIRKRDELNTFIKIMQEMIGGEVIQPGGELNLSGETPRVEVTDPLAAVYPGMFFGKSQPQAVKVLLDLTRPRPMKTRVILECLEKGGMRVGGKKPAVNLWGVLNRNSDIFILVPKAGWGLVDWYEPGVIAKYRKEGSKEGDEGNGDESEK